MSAPDISVIMGVYNGADSLKTTLQSVLSQRGVNLELIVVNDGSTDGTAKLLESIAKTDARLTFINQENTGLTQALIIGCGLARGKFIARQDAGDLSLAGRLKSQYETLNSNSDLVMASAATEFVTPTGEFLYLNKQSEQSAETSLKINDAKLLAGPPHHGSVMFRRDTYIKVGGYRPEFLVAQDIDLWVRLVEHGEHCSLQQTLYRAVVHKNSISMSKREQQLKTVQFIIESRKIRTQSLSDDDVLRSLREYYSTADKKPIPKNRSDSNYYYFLGSCIRQYNAKAAKKYLSKAVIANPFNWRARVKLWFTKYK